MENNAWRPTAGIDNIKARAALYKTIRDFFAEREVLEVETPLIGLTNCPDRQIEPFHITIGQEDFCLQTSPEFYMKRLLAAGVGSTYQICKAFRQGEVGGRHNPEFTMLEWYRVGWTHEDLIKDVEALLSQVLGTGEAIHVEYADLFKEFLSFDPFDVTVDALVAIARKLDPTCQLDLDKEAWLDYLMTHYIEPKLNPAKLWVIKYFLPSQAALSKISSEQYAERFEFFYRGMELANGYHEVTCSKELRARFNDDIQWRKENHRPDLKMDEKFLEAIDSMPPCAGVAMGLDRLLMMMTGAKTIQDVVAFPYQVL